MPPEEQNDSFRSRLKEYVVANKTIICCTITGAVTAAAVAGMQKSALKEAYDFIDAAGLTEKFIESVPPNEIYT